ncbi:hypothetical protein Hamer_G025426, partial [Homarus americanus]
VMAILKLLYLLPHGPVSVVFIIAVHSSDSLVAQKEIITPAPRPQVLADPVIPPPTAFNTTTEGERSGVGVTTINQEKVHPGFNIISAANINHFGSTNRTPVKKGPRKLQSKGKAASMATAETISPAAAKAAANVVAAAAMSAKGQSQQPAAVSNSQVTMAVMSSDRMPQMQNLPPPVQIWPPVSVSSVTQMIPLGVVTTPLIQPQIQPQENQAVGGPQGPPPPYIEMMRSRVSPCLIQPRNSGTKTGHQSHLLVSAIPAPNSGSAIARQVQPTQRALPKTNRSFSPHSACLQSAPSTSPVAQLSQQNNKTHTLMDIPTKVTTTPATTTQSAHSALETIKRKEIVASNTNMTILALVNQRLAETPTRVYEPQELMTGAAEVGWSQQLLGKDGCT